MRILPHETKVLSPQKRRLRLLTTSLRMADVSTRSSPLRDVSQGGMSATQRQKFHTKDVKQCLHNKSGSHGVPNANLFNFTFLLVDLGKVLCSTANELQKNSNASSGEDYIPQILTVLLEVHRVSIWPLQPFVFCLSSQTIAKTMKLLHRPIISASDRIPDRFCVISMEFLSLSRRLSCSRNVSQLRWERRNVCRSQAIWPHNMSKTKQVTHRGGVAFQIRAKCPQLPKFWDRKFFMTSLCPCCIQDGGSMTLKHGMKQKMNKKMNVYVVVQFCPWFKFYSPLFLAMVICDNEFETKEKIWTKDKIEPQHIHR